MYLSSIVGDQTGCPWKQKMRKSTLLATSFLTLSTVLPTFAQPPIETRNVILVHGAVLDGSGWRQVHDRLVTAGLHVSVVQLPLTSLEDDVAATNRVINRQDGPTVLVGSSYGGAVISVAGMDPKVTSLVYVSALQPEAGESVADLNGKWPMELHGLDLGDGKGIVDPAYFHAEVAADLPMELSAFLAASQKPTAYSVYTTPLPAVGWHDKPSFGIVAANDRTLDPDMLRWMYKRSGAEVIELDTAHLPHISQPSAVANLIIKAALKIN